MGLGHEVYSFLEVERCLRVIMVRLSNTFVTMYDPTFTPVELYMYM